jgi:pimeloyl-ACP methyl ester carboxylesterase
MTASEAIRKSGMNDQGEFIVSFVEGVEQYQDTVLFISGACNTIIGPDFQKDHMKLFPKTKLVVIEEAGHTMLSEKPVQCQAIIREFLN